MKKISLLLTLGLLVFIIACQKTNNIGPSNYSDGHLRIVNDTCCLYLPNIFTPDSNGRNDTYYAIGKNLTSFLMEVKDTNSNLLFTSSVLSNGWDGMFGNTLQAETFYESHIVASFTCGTTIDTNLYFYLGQNNSTGCIPKYTTTTPLYFGDQVDPVAPCYFPPYPSGDTLCP